MTHTDFDTQIQTSATDKKATKLDAQALQNWLAYSLAPMSLLHLLNRHGMQVGRDITQPFSDLNPFWRQQMPKVDPSVLKAVLHWLDADENHQCIVQGDPLYPELLADINSPPRMLYCAGDARLLTSPLLAVVGSRRASPYALTQVSDITANLVRHGWGICSGMAMGVDGAAHRAALEQGGKTVAVLGCGVDICYPPRQQTLYRDIQQQGLLVSEFYPGAPARSDHFLRRNRIISGLSQGVWVAEASLRSGSLATANFGLEQNRVVYALPGPVTMPSFAGNHKLLQQGAALITCAEDILAELPVLKCRPELENEGSRPHSHHQSLGLAQKRLANSELLANVGFETTSIDSLVTRTRLPVAALMDQLITLELDGWVTAVPGGYVRVRRE